MNSSSVTSQLRGFWKSFLGPKTTKTPIGSSLGPRMTRSWHQEFFASVKDFFDRLVIDLSHDDEGASPTKRASCPTASATRSGLTTLSARLRSANDKRSLKKLSSDIQDFAKEHPAAQKKLESMLKEITKKLARLRMPCESIPPALGTIYTGL